jgi:hypothetical protein
VGSLPITAVAFNENREPAQQSRNQSVWPFTPKAFANFSPGLERRANPGIKEIIGNNNAASGG